MNIAEIKYCDIANGKGVRTSVFVSGCRHCCPNCFNQIAWDFNYGKRYDKDIENEIIESLTPDYITGITILGGEPFEVENQQDLIKLLQKVKEKHPSKNVWIYTGFTYEELLSNSRASGENAMKLLSLVDVLVDGRFIESLKNISLAFKGSENQRIIDVKKTLKSGVVELYNL